MWDVGGDAQRKRVNMCALDVRWRMPAGKQDGWTIRNGPLHVLKVNEGEGASVWEFVKKQGARVRCRHWSSQRQARPIQASSILCSISNAADTGQLKGRHRGKRG
eukprot:1140736-Pelagomonas_calceolata.AAC.8